MTAETLTLTPGAGPPTAGAGLDLLSRMHDTVDLSALLSVAPRRTPDVELGGGHGMLRTPRKRYDRVELPLVLWVRGLDATGAIPAGSDGNTEFYRNALEILAVLAADQVTIEHGLPDGSARWITGEVVSVLDPTRRNPGSLGQLAVKITCAYPFWTETGTARVATNTSTGAPTAWTVAEFVGADAPIEDLTVRFAATVGTVPNPVITHGAISLAYEATLTAGQYVEFDCATWDVTGGAGLTPDLSKIVKAGGETRYFVLDPTGAVATAPSVTIDHTGTGTLTATLTGRRRFKAG